VARGQIPFVVIDTSGNAVVGANVTLTNRVTATPATVWADETTTANQLGNPVLTDAKGRVPGWLDEGAYSASISGAGITTYSTNFEVLSGRGTNLVAPNAVGPNQIQSSAILAAALAASAISSLLPAGLILPFGGNTAPSGWVLCDGATYNGNLAAYQNLWAAITTTYGGTGQGAFQVPDLRGRVPLGAGTAAGARGATAKALGAKGGEETTRLTSGQSGVPAHGHPHTIAVSVGGGAHDGEHDHSFYPPQLAGGSNVITHGLNPYTPNMLGYVATSGTHMICELSGNQWGAGGGGAHGHPATVSGSVTNNTAADAVADHNSLPPYQVITYIIKL
jgi:hypothetical protein